MVHIVKIYQWRVSVYNLQVYQCLLSTSRKILGPSTILQAALPDILEKVPQSYFENTMNVVEVSGNCTDEIS